MTTRQLKYVRSVRRIYMNRLNSSAQSGNKWDFMFIPTLEERVKKLEVLITELTQRILIIEKIRTSGRASKELTIKEKIMPIYKVLQEFELEGVAQSVDSQVELSEEAAAPLVAEGKVELVPAVE